MIEIYFALKCRIGCSKIGVLWNKLLNVFFSILYPLYCKHVKPEIGICESGEGEDIIVSLTSFPERINSIHLCLRSLLRQSKKPNKIILWLAENQFENIQLPDSLLDLKQYGVDIHFCAEDLRPHKKLYYALSHYRSSVIITVDDDVVYDRDLIARLYNAYKKNGRCVYCNIAHEITLNNGKPDYYDNWNGGAIGKSGISNYYTAIGIGGVLYPPNPFDDEYYDIELIKRLALSADDIWLKFAEIRNNIPVCKIKDHAKYPFVIPSTQKKALTKINNGQNKNDIVIQNLCDYYSIDWNNLNSNLERNDDYV